MEALVALCDEDDKPPGVLGSQDIARLPEDNSTSVAPTACQRHLQTSAATADPSLRPKVSTSNLNPRVPEFKSAVLQENYTAPPPTIISPDLARIEQDMARNELELRKIIRKQEELESFLRTNGNFQQEKSKASQSRKRINVIDDKTGYGREVEAVEQWFASKQLGEFQKKYPLTGNKHADHTAKPPPRFPKSMLNAIHPVIAAHPDAVMHQRNLHPNTVHADTVALQKKQKAAQVQLKLEMLLLEKKEKKALEKKLASLNFTQAKLQAHDGAVAVTTPPLEG